MASWIYIFSRFTQEALLFEALAIFTLCAGYAAFWVLRKRKLGVLRNTGIAAPANVVKGVLNELIFDAEQLRTQLFGLLAGDEAAAAGHGAFRTAALSAISLPSSEGLAAAAPELTLKLAALESKMSEQAKAAESLLADKAKMELELKEARANKGTGAPAGDQSKLQEKINELEGRLAEYSVIEDDLANLKRLQQENAKLKAQLAGQGGAAASPAAAAASAASGASAAPADVAASEAITEPAAAAVTEVAAAAAEASPVAETLTDPLAAATADPTFEGLVDQVEQSLTEPAAAQAAPQEAVAATPAPAKSAPMDVAKGDADLVAEFEKMLNS